MPSVRQYQPGDQVIVGRGETAAKGTVVKFLALSERDTGIYYHPDGSHPELPPLWAHHLEVRPAPAEKAPVEHDPAPHLPRNNEAAQAEAPAPDSDVIVEKTEKKEDFVDEKGS